uniref:Uncharacterized protein MANES_13G045600 n=1 Tax=Rhizophora mucronata TaxID=61149 RepID=A0A2P2MRH8_RHIMU
MDWSSWFRRNLLKNSGSKSTQNPHKPDQLNQPRQVILTEEEEQFGVTQQLLDHIKSFTLDIFKNFPLAEDAGSAGVAYCDETPTATTSANVRKDLSEWQQRHAVLVLSRAQELSQLRFMLCPCHLKEQQFWRIYFMLVKHHVSEYELQAIRLEKLKKMAIGNENSSDASAPEIEMAETNQAQSLTP